MSPNWTPAGTPGTGDTAAITGLSTGYQTITGPGTGPGGASALKLVGNTALSSSFDFGTMTVGSSVVGGLTVLAGSTVQADTETLLQGTLDVVGTGARLVARGTLALGGARGGTASGFVRSVLTATSEAAVQAGSLALLPITGNFGSDAIQVDGTSTLEVGTAGGAALGKLTVDAGATLIGSADILTFNGFVNNGTLVARSYGLALTGASVTSTGQFQIDPGASLNLNNVQVSKVDVVFNDNTSLLRLGVYNGPLNEQGRITGFVPGDTIAVYSSQSTLTGVTYQAVSGGLGTLAIRSGAATVASLTLAGNYSGYAFKLNQPFSNSYEVTAVAPAAPANAFLTTDTATSTSPATAGTAYAGPVIGLERQFIWASPHGVAMASIIGNTFIHGGSGDDALSVTSGTNVLDGGTGSNFLTGATGANGGTSTRPWTAPTAIKAPRSTPSWVARGPG